jgi:hypothetical protein
MTQTMQSKSHYLYLLVSSAVSRGPDGISVRDIARELGYDPQVIAHCIGLHLYLDRRSPMEVPFAVPMKYVAPDPHDIITRGMLLPPPQPKREAS